MGDMVDMVSGSGSRSARECGTGGCTNPTPTPRSKYCGRCAKKRLRRQNREAQERRRARARGEYRRTGSAYVDAYAALHAITTEIAAQGGEATITSAQSRRLVRAAGLAVQAMGHDLSDEQTRLLRVPRTLRGNPQPTAR
jgi:hypothetical protein